jgi:membrane associated rhomboid family serine protease
LRAWLLVCGVLAGTSLAVAWVSGVVPPPHDVFLHPLAWDASRWASRPWTLWTSAWVHTSGGNLAGNLLALGALAVLGHTLGARRAAALALLAAWPLSTWALTLWPEVSSYAGLGGVIHAAAAIIGIHVAGRPELKPFSPLVFAAIGLKLIAERAWMQPVAFDPSWGFNVVYAAHLTGALAGALCGAATRLITAMLRRPVAGDPAVKPP